MKTFTFQVYWTMASTVEVQAVDLNEALAKVQDGPLPENGNYLEGTFEVESPEDLD